MQGKEPRDDLNERANAGQLVVIQPRVIENADHVFGNLFQRLYYGVSQVGDRDPVLGAELSDSARQVEAALQLLLDYIAPFPPALERFAVTELASSLAQRVESAVACAVVPPDAGDGEPAHVLADPGRLARAFDLMASCLRGDGGLPSAAIVSEAETAVVTLCLRLPAAALAVRTSVGDLRWAVAQKLVEIHGGALAQSEEPAGEVTWKVSLPRAR